MKADMIKKATELDMRQAVMQDLEGMKRTLARLMKNQRATGYDYARAEVAIAFAVLHAERVQREIEELEEQGGAS